MRARTEIETDELRNRQAIVVTELPYQVNKARLIEKIAELVKDRNWRASPNYATNPTRTACAFTSNCDAARPPRWC